MILIPRLYAILEASWFADTAALLVAAEELVTAGVSLIQYRNKSGDAREMLNQALELGRRSWTTASAPHIPRLVMNDRADLCLAAEFDGVHVGRDDLSTESARKIICRDSWPSVCTHDPDQGAEVEW